MTDEPMRQCGLCGRGVPPGEGYVVRIDIFADPELPPVTGQQIEALDFDATFAELMEQIKQMSAEELQDGVYRRMEYRLCPPCHRRYLANPLGIPRDTQVGRN